MPASSTTLFLIIDLQVDFCPGGALAVPDGNAVVPLVNRLAGRFDHVALTQDWHPAGHTSFASSHPGKTPFETIDLDYGPQTLWPDHCVQDSTGAAFHADLDTTPAEFIVRKGFRPGIDSYSAFFENDQKTPTGLAGYLRERGFTRVVMAGLAYDYCVRWSAEDARRQGFDATVVTDACRSIDLNGSHDAATEALREAGVVLVDSDAFR